VLSASLQTATNRYAGSIDWISTQKAMASSRHQLAAAGMTAFDCPI
jgi:hypothetical protein